MWTTDTISVSTIHFAWTGFVAAASCFGAEFPVACDAFLTEDLECAELAKLPNEYTEALPLLLRAIGCAVDYRQFGDGEPIAAGLDMRLDPWQFVVGFGSGRSRVEMWLSRGVYRLEFGLRVDPTTVDESASESVRARIKAALAAIEEQA